MSNHSSTADRNFEAEYVEVRKNWHQSDGSMAARNEVAKESAKIARAARKAGVALDELGLDEQARKQATK